jgi:hypothetical protein
MSSWSAQLRGAENLAPEMQEAFMLGVQRGLERVGIRGEEIVRQNISTPYGNLPPAVAFGNLLASITSSFVRDASMCREIIGVSPSVGADVYAAPVETGTRPHMPPASALVQWVMKKFGISDEKQVMSIAFAIATKIRQRGTQGHFMFGRAIEELEWTTPEILEAAVAETFRELGFAGGAA